MSLWHFLDALYVGYAKNYWLKRHIQWGWFWKFCFTVMGRGKRLELLKFIVKLLVSVTSLHCCSLFNTSRQKIYLCTFSRYTSLMQYWLRRSLTRKVYTSIVSIQWRIEHFSCEGRYVTDWALLLVRPQYQRGPVQILNCRGGNYNVIPLNITGNVRFHKIHNYNFM